MKAVLALAALGGAALAAADCTNNHPGVFSFQTQNITKAASKRDLGDLIGRQTTVTQSCGNYVTIRLNNGVLNDGASRVGNIVGNFQFQFDYPIQDQSKVDTGFQICDGNIAVGTDTIFYQCKSGDFYNLYYGYGADVEQCNPVYLSTFDCTPSSSVPLSPSPFRTDPTSPGLAGAKTGLPSGFKAASGPATNAPSATSAPASSSAAPASSSVVAPSSSSVAAVVSTPYPVAKNTTVPAPTGGVAPPPSLTTTAAAGGKASSTSAAAKASFTGAANVLAVGQKVVAAAAGFAAFAMF